MTVYLVQVWVREDGCMQSSYRIFANKNVAEKVAAENQTRVIQKKVE